jgi:hypothetical protein
VFEVDVAMVEAGVAQAVDGALGLLAVVEGADGGMHGVSLLF